MTFMTVPMESSFDGNGSKPNFDTDSPENSNFVCLSKYNAYFPDCQVMVDKGLLVLCKSMEEPF